MVKCVGFYVYLSCAKALARLSWEFQSVDQTAVSHSCSSSPERPRELRAHASSRCGDDPPGNNTHSSARVRQYNNNSRSAKREYTLGLLKPGNIFCPCQSPKGVLASSTFRTFEHNANNYDYYPLSFMEQSAFTRGLQIAARQVY